MGVNSESGDILVNFRPGVCRYKAKFSMPESIAVEKINMMKTLGAEVILTP